MIKKFILAISYLPFKIWNLLLFQVTNSEKGENLVTHGQIIRRGKGFLQVGNNCKINSNATKNPVGIAHNTMFYIAPEAEIIIHNNVGISTSLFYSRSKIEIEDNVLVGGGCQFLDNDFHSLDYDERVHNGDKMVKSAPIIVREGAFIGTSSIILKGVTIGARSIVAAGSVVSKDIPPLEIWGGNPAKFIKKLKD